MMEKERIKKISTHLSVNRTNYMLSFRGNLHEFLNEPDMTVYKLADEANLPYSTLNSLLYGNSNDTKLSTAVALARAFGISVDELVGCGTMEDKMLESVKICRSLPEHSLYLIRYFIRHQDKIYSSLEKSHKYISVLKPQLVNGIIATTNAVEPICIDNLPEDIKSKTYIGLKIPCDYYMPFYLPGEIILLAADREPQDGERCIVTSNGGIYIVVKTHIIEDGVRKWRYVPLMSPNSILPENLIDDMKGYVVGFVNNDGDWGIR